MFKVGDTMVYGSVGVCTVEDICVPDVPGATKLCYLLKPLYMPDTKVYAPVENNSVPMRKVMSPSEANDLIDALPGIEPLTPEDKNEAQRAYKSALQSADGMQWAQLVKTLYAKRKLTRENQKAFPGFEKDVLTSAEALLHGEMAHTLKIRVENVVEYIDSRLSYSHAM